MTLLYEGILLNSSRNRQEPFFVRELNLNDLPEIEETQQEVISALPEKDVLQPLSKEEFLFILNGRGRMLGAFTGDRLIAFRALLIPPIDEEHLGRDIGLPETEWPRVIYQEISVVHPDYRGNRLQQKLAELIMQMLSETDGQFRYVACTVAPFNIPSLKDKFSQQMQIAAMKEKYGGMLRYILVKDLELPESFHSRTFSVPFEDLQLQKELLEKGCRGVGIGDVKGKVVLYFSDKQ